MRPQQPTESEQISAWMTVEDVLTRHPAVLEVFVERRMHCFGCPIAQFETIAEACEEYQQPLAAVLADLNRVIGGATRNEPGA